MRFTKLPKTWWIKVNKENQKVLSEWRFGNKKNKLDVGYITGMYDWRNTISKEHNPKNDGLEWGIEITFEEFEYFILNKNKEIIYEIY